MTSTLIPSIGEVDIVEVFFYSEQPLIFSAESRLGDMYLVSYADLTDDGDKWYFIRISNQRLTALKKRQIDLRGCFLQSEAGYTSLVEYFDDGSEPKTSYFRSDAVEVTQYYARGGVHVAEKFSLQQNSNIRFTPANVEALRNVVGGVSAGRRSATRFVSVASRTQSNLTNIRNVSVTSQMGN